MTEERRRQVVVACCEIAKGAGVRAGMPLAQARALFDADRVRVVRHDAAREGAALRSLAAWAHRLAPVVAPDPPDGLLMDVTGCEEVWGGDERFGRVSLARLGHVGVRARVAVAPTFGCAWAVSRFGGEEVAVVAHGGQRAALAGLPIAALGTGAETIADLATVGVERIGQLLELPRATVPARFGEDLLLRLDRALGQAIETIDPVRPARRHVVERVFDGPTDRTEAIEQTVRELLEALAAGLIEDGLGAGRVEIELARSDLEPERLAITMGRPSHDAGHLWTLARPKLERAHLGFGVEGVRVEAVVTARVRGEQGGLHLGGERGLGGGDRAGGQCSGSQYPGNQYAGSQYPGNQFPGNQFPGGRAFQPATAPTAATLLDALANRLGADRVVMARVVESHEPERAFVMVGWDAHTNALGWASAGWKARPPVVHTHSPVVHAHSPVVHDSPVVVHDRPTLLFDRAAPVEVVMVSPDGPVHRVMARGEGMDVIRCVGPERIGGEWWRNEASGERDFFRVCLADGRWVWLERRDDRGSVRWALRGVWG